MPSHKLHIAHRIEQLVWHHMLTGLELICLPLEKQVRRQVGLGLMHRCDSLLTDQIESETSDAMTAVCSRIKHPEPQ
jgi:hypothetical protein